MSFVIAAIVVAIVMGLAVFALSALAIYKLKERPVDTTETEQSVSETGYIITDYTL